LEGGVVPSSGDTIRQLFKRGAESVLNPYGYSDIERGTCEIQSVEVKTGDTVAYDWTVAALSNYFNNKAKAIFTGNRGYTHEVVFLALIPSTSMSDVAQLLEQAVKRRKHFEPSVLYSDTCPHNTAFFHLLHGDKLAHVLGLFHLLQRMIKTYNKRSEDYWKMVDAHKKQFILTITTNTLLSLEPSRTDLSSLLMGSNIQ
jgi:hypothetical protein